MSQVMQFVVVLFAILAFNAYWIFHHLPSTTTSQDIYLRTTATSDVSSSLIPPISISDTVHRGLDDEFLSFFERNNKNLILVSGVDGTGKSVLVRKALRDRDDVHLIQAFSTDSVDEVFGRIGNSGSEQSARSLLQQHYTGAHRRPVIVIDYKLTGTNVQQPIPKFRDLLLTAASWQLDWELCHVVLMISDSPLLFYLPLTGVQYNEFHVTDFSAYEATLFLQEQGVDSKKVAQYLDRLGTRPRDLVGLVATPDKEKYFAHKERAAREKLATSLCDGANQKNLHTVIQRVKNDTEVLLSIASSLLYPNPTRSAQIKYTLQFIHDTHFFQLKEGNVSFYSKMERKIALEKDFDKWIQGLCVQKVA